MKQIKHVFEYSIFIILRAFILALGFEKACKFCVYSIRKISPLLPATKTAKRNIKRALGEDNLDRHMDMLLENYGRYIAEFIYLNHLPRKELEDRIEIEGIENIKYLQENNQPFLVCLAHLANWDFLIHSISKLSPKFSIIYRKANNPYIDKYLLRSREIKPDILSNDSGAGPDGNVKDTNHKGHVQMIAKGPKGARELITAIKQKHSIAMLVDQKMNDGIEVPFFGMPAMTANAIAKLSMQYDYPIVPVQIIRKSGSYFKAIVHPPLDNKTICGNPSLEGKSDDYKIMLHINRLIEDWIRQNPGQWFWFHNRWKK